MPLSPQQFDAMVASEIVANLKLGCQPEDELAREAVMSSDQKPRSLPRCKLPARAAGVFAALVLIGPCAWAQDYPLRPVRMVVPYAPGGITDTFARHMAQGLSEHFGKQFYVENMTGGSGNVGTAQAARAAPDGHTILVAFSSYVVNPTLFDRLPYDPHKDFVPVSLAVASTTVLVVNPSLPAKNLKELVDLIRANPGKFSFGSAGTGTQAHLAGEQLRLSLKLDLVHVPYNGGGPAAAAALANHTPIAFTSPAAALQLVRDGKLRALAVTAKQRTQILPEVETMAEAGYPDIEGDSWVGLMLPAGTAPEIVALLHDAVVKVLAAAEMQQRLATLGYDIIASTPEEFGRRIDTEIVTWGRIMRAAGIRRE